jgi:hypothetical protein
LSLQMMDCFPELVLIRQRVPSLHSSGRFAVAILRE